MPQVVSDRKALLQAFWRKAFKDGQVAIPCPDANTAKKIRLDLYNSVKKVKADPTLDPELHMAVKRCVISFATPTMLLVKRGEAELMLVEAALIAGIDVSAQTAAPESQAEVNAMASATKLQEKLGSLINQGHTEPAPAPGYRQNKFYARD
jgi:hypothetical protein